MSSLYKRSLFIWLLFIPIAIVNGVVRDVYYKPLLGDALSHQVSTLFAIIAFISLSSILLQRYRKEMTSIQAITIGIIWLLLTILFEFVFGYFVDHKSLYELFADYNILGGRLWVLFLMSEFVTPILLILVDRKKVSNHKT